MYKNRYKKNEYINYELERKMRKMELWQTIFNSITALAITIGSYFYYEDRRQSRQFIEDVAKNVREDVGNQMEKVIAAVASIAKDKKEVIAEHKESIVENVKAAIEMISKDKASGSTATAVSPYISQQTTDLLLTFGFYTLVGLAGVSIIYFGSCKIYEGMSNTAFGKLLSFCDQCVQATTDKMSYIFGINIKTVEQFGIDACGNTIKYVTRSDANGVLDVAFFVKKDGVFFPINDFSKFFGDANSIQKVTDIAVKTTDIVSLLSHTPEVVTSTALIPYVPQEALNSVTKVAETFVIPDSLADKNLIEFASVLASKNTPASIEIANAILEHPEIFGY